MVGCPNAGFPIHYIYGPSGHCFKIHYVTLSNVVGPKMVNFSGESGAKYFDERKAQQLIQDEQMLRGTYLFVWNRNKALATSRTPH